MNKAFWVVPFLLFPLSFVTANTFFDCPEVSIEVDDDELEIDGLTAPIEIVKVFNATYSLVYECNGNCPEEIELSNLSEGSYNIDIQSYTSNWRFICNQRETVVITSEEEPDCSNIAIDIEEDQLRITNLNSPNKIIKVFDVFYNLIDVCYFNCGEEFVVPNFLAGLYRVDIQLYTANWQFICERKEDFLINLDDALCDNSPCQGNVLLQSQADVDEFCGCKVVEGNLTIGKSGNSNISSLSNLRNIEEVKGTLSIENTKIQDFDGLGNLGKIGREFILSKNNFITNFKGLTNLVEITGLLHLKEHGEIRSLKGLDRWTKVGGIKFTNNNNLADLSKLAQLTKLESIDITACGKLKELPALTLIDSLSGLTIRNNTRLQNLEFLGAIEYLSGNVNITGNVSLSDCCALYRFVDGDTGFGNNNAFFNISDNAFSCRSIAAILSKCQPNEPSCADINVSTSSNKITISGLTAPNEIIKVFDANYRVLYNCFGNCEEIIQVNNLPKGTYRISINFYNENWVPICEALVTVVLDEGDSSVSFNDRSTEKLLFGRENFSLSPNPALGVTYVDLKTVEGLSVDLQLINQFGQKVWQKRIDKATGVPQKIDLYSFQNGLYFLQIRVAGGRVRTKKLMINRLY